MEHRKLTVALIHEVFPGPENQAALISALTEAAGRGADLAVLPELGVDRWIPATRTVADDDCEPPGGPRQQRLAAAAHAAGVAVLGGAIVDDPTVGGRRNRALLYTRDGAQVAAYDKLHLPCEPGFWESDHYEAGTELPAPIDALGLPIGLQICSDLNRPTACQLLGRRGAAAIFAPRATPPGSFSRWLAVIRADAITSGAYLVSVNRPRPEGGADIGGPSVVAAPDGTVLAETTDPLTLVTLDPRVVAEARREYPGYLDVRADLYARGWSDVAS